MTRALLAAFLCATQGCKGRSATKSKNGLVLSTALAALLCATAAHADTPTHQVVIHTPGGDVASEPMPRDLCMSKAAQVHGRLFPVPIQEDGVPVIVMVRLFASCVPLGVAS